MATPIMEVTCECTGPDQFKLWFVALAGFTGLQINLSESLLREARAAINKCLAEQDKRADLAEALEKVTQ